MLRTQLSVLSLAALCFLGTNAMAQQLDLSGATVIMSSGENEALGNGPLMFDGDRQALIDSAVVTDEESARITADITMLHGRNDKPCPAAETTLVVAEKLPKADVILLSDCGHNLPRERTGDYLAAARALFNPELAGL